ncbi:hypothetical protein LFL97_32645 [Burkholderia sp. JSH-S8]|nr:hypothetical protein LFL97_32645 [Burkholderia sp. JSH-S8]
MDRKPFKNGVRCHQGDNDQQIVALQHNGGTHKHSLNQENQNQHDIELFMKSNGIANTTTTVSNCARRLGA